MIDVTNMRSVDDWSSLVRWCEKLEKENARLNQEFKGARQLIWLLLDKLGGKFTVQEIDFMILGKTHYIDIWQDPEDGSRTYRATKTGKEAS